MKNEMEKVVCSAVEHHQILTEKDIKDMKEEVSIKIYRDSVEIIEDSLRSNLLFDSTAAAALIRDCFEREDLNKYAYCMIKMNIYDNSFSLVAECAVEVGHKHYSLRFDYKLPHWDRECAWVYEEDLFTMIENNDCLYSFCLDDDISLRSMSSGDEMMA